MASGGTHIKRTYLYNFDPLKPYFYIVKLGFTVVYIIFLISAQKAQKHRLWILIRTASVAVLMSTHNPCFEQKYEKISELFIWKFSFLVVKFSVYLNRHVFVMWLNALGTVWCQFWFKFNGPANTVKDMLSRSFYLTTQFLGGFFFL